MVILCSHAHTQRRYACRPVTVLFLAGRVAWLPGVVPILRTRVTGSCTCTDRRVPEKSGFPFPPPPGDYAVCQKAANIEIRLKIVLFSQSHYTHQTNEVCSRRPVTYTTVSSCRKKARGLGTWPGWP